MKRVYQYAFVLLATAVAAAGCKNDEYDNRSPFDNVVYLDVAEADATQLTTFKKTLPTLERDFSVVMSYPASEDVQVTVEVEPALVADYNARNATSWTMLDAAYYELAENTVTIPAGKTISDRLSLMLKNLDGSGDVAELPIDETYLLPVTIRSASGGVSLLGSSATAYYVVKRSSAITSAASLRDNWINFPTLDKAGPQSDLFNNLTAVTYEAIIRVDDFSKHSEISTIMGVENYLLLRIGDASFPRQQLQFDGTGDAAATPGFGKFPKKDESKLLNAGEWYHIAATYSYATREVCIYVNGKLQSRGTDLGNPASTPLLRPLFAEPLAVRTVQGLGQFPSVLPREVLRRHAPVERRHHRGPRLERGPQRAGDLGEHVRRRPADAGADRLLEIRRGRGQRHP